MSRPVPITTGRTRDDETSSEHLKPAAARFTTWNAEWATPSGHAWTWASEVLLETTDLGVFTEVRLDALARWGGHSVSASNDWGYPSAHPDRRKVALWSRNLWSDVDPVGSAAFPSGRFVAGTTPVDDQAIRVVGVCVPWHAAHVSTGRCDRSMWQDHGDYLATLGSVIDDQSRHGLPVVVAGDFNQRAPGEGGRAPAEAVKSFAAAVANLSIASRGLTGRTPILDHIATTPDLTATKVTVVEAFDFGRELSDHDAIQARLAIHPRGCGR
jgi:hypothetical protein